MGTETELEQLQRLIDVSDEQIAAKCEPPMSKTTYRRAKKGEAPIETQDTARHALEALRVEKIDRLSRVKTRTG